MRDLVDLVFHPSPSMERLYLELTSKCNLTCEMCYRQTWQEPDGDMTLDLLRKIARGAESFPGLREVILGGIGEPTFAPIFRQAVQIFAPRYEVTVTTNGITLDDELINFLMEQGIARIVLSVDSIDTDTFATIRHQSVQILMNNTRKMALRKHQPNHKPEIAWEFLLMKRTLPYLLNTVKVAAEIGVDKLYISHIQPMSPAMQEEILYPGAPEIDKVLMQAFQLGLTHQLSVQLPKNVIKTERHCRFVETQSAVVRWDGQVSPCYRFLHSYPEYVLGRRKFIDAYSFGSVRAKTLEEIWSEPEYMKFRYKVRNAIYPSCTDCDFGDGCDIATRADMDCLLNVPSCGDCLWARGITYCP